MRSLATLACTLTLATGLGACTEDDPTPPPPTTAPTAPTTPAATAPVMPELGSEFSANGAATFVAYYVKVLDYSSRTGDTARLRQMSDAACTGCFSYIDLFEQTHADGGWADREWGKSSVRIRFSDQVDVPSYVTLKLTIGAGQYRTSSNREVQEAQSVTSAVTFAASFDRGWTVLAFGKAGGAA